MTNEQHIENLKKLKSFHNGLYDASINAAINALEHEQALGEAFNIALLYGKEKGMEAIGKALYQMGMDGIKEQEIEALEQESYKVSEYDKDHIWYKGWQYISLRRFLEVKKALKQEPKIVPIAEIKFDEDKLKELVDKTVLTVAPQEPKTGFIPKSVIEDIKAEIKEEADCSMGEIGDGYYDALDIIDKHIGGAKMVELQERNEE